MTKDNIRPCRDDLTQLYPRRGLAAWRLWLTLSLGCILFFWGLDALGFSLQRLVSGSQRLGNVLLLMWPPQSKGQFLTYLIGIGQTLAMALLGTLTASILAFFFCLFGARNIMPFGPIRVIVRRSSDVIRGLDSLIWAIFFVSIVGIGPFAGILAIAVNDMGVLTKLFAEAMENTERDQIKGVRSTGASRLQTIRFGIIPQVIPVLVANTLYFLESNVRSATILGVVGAGGIGFYLMDRMMISAWREVAFIVIMILFTVAIIDTLSRALRARLLGQTILASK